MDALFAKVEALEKDEEGATIVEDAVARGAKTPATHHARITRLLGRLIGLCALLALAAVVATTPALAGTIVTYTGQGFTFDDTTANLKNERCGLTGQDDADDGGTGQFADWNGPGQPYQEGQPYLLWVLTANGATSAKLNLPGGSVDMIQVGGTFKYASQYYNYNALVGLPVTAKYQGTVRGNVQLVVSHGCQPFEGEEGAWCSPGFWRNAADAAWALTGHAKTDLFNDTVVPDFYDTASAANPTLIQVLTTPNANTFGAASGPYGLNAFNATGAFLTDQLPGFHFDPSRIGEENACPIDNSGNFKQ
ncbi:hypothetical protein [Zobellella iuensis]|uniref:Uncharacterized protein n=1 Tax=Zobellella iuensis TaxID=2803811 RepID=A0ABS1QXY5_9GAMM|nr:hypothetical protein [Zobellella iuensis]MBL1379321.1 hypothetical protein [Zobellella iuensis]